MSFLRPLGIVASAALASTGVGIPVAIAVGSVITVAGNVAADKIEEKEQREKADAAAAEQKRKADEEIKNKEAEEKAKADRIRKNLEEQLAQTEAVKSILEMCRSGNIDNLPTKLKQLTNEKFTEMGLRPLQECATPEVQARVLDILEAEHTRRG